MFIRLLLLSALVADLDLADAIIRSIMITAMIIEMALPKFHSPTVINWFSIIFPMRKYCPPAQKLGDKEGADCRQKYQGDAIDHTRRDKGNVTRPKVCTGPAPRSALASRSE